MKKWFVSSSPLLFTVVLVASSFGYVTCQVRTDEYMITSTDLSELEQVDISELTPTEVQRLDRILNNEASPCADGYSLAQTLLNPNVCPISIHARDFIITLLKQDYDEEEISQRYVERYSAAEGEVIPLGDSPRRGALNPVVSVVVFSDFQCPHCASTAVELDKVVDAYPEHVEIVFKNFPLEKIHPAAMLGARAGYAALQQDKFWEMHDVIFSRGQAGFDPDRIRTFAIGLGLDIEKFESDLASDESVAAVSADMELGAKLGVSGTPVIFVNGRRLEGGVQTLEARIREEFLRKEFVKK